MQINWSSRAGDSIRISPRLSVPKAAVATRCVRHFLLALCDITSDSFIVRTNESFELSLGHCIVGESRSVAFVT